INIRGNTRTRDYVIRREFDIAEGDAYNRVLVDRAERRLKNLAYFKTVKITNEPGSAPDRIILNVDVEEQSTGEFEVSFVEPYLLDYRLAFGVDFFAKQVDASSYYVYRQETIGGGLRFGVPIREDVGLSLRYSLYRQSIDLDQTLRNCNNVNPDFATTFPTFFGAPNGLNPATLAPPGYTGLSSCYLDGEASAAVKQQVAAGPAIISLVGYGLTYNTVDNNKNPTRGILVDLRQDFAGVGGDVNFIR